ncbi:26630_t:CDS:2 [Dentiscutata erythropus]|uniref:26630_t:CDS:1 n=1 Tax=Dentiscutata erythropus TaxID=1348616 RepID=A0A9N9AVQ4_9GLOM|nr:26630_t:CDS:2 [Dentiscutata erythropus]
MHLTHVFTKAARKLLAKNSYKTLKAKVESEYVEDEFETYWQDILEKSLMQTNLANKENKEPVTK